MPKEWFTSVGNNADTYNLDSIKDTLVHDDRDSANHVEIIPYRIHHGTSGGHNLWTLKEEMINISVVPVKMIKCPVGLFDKTYRRDKTKTIQGCSCNGKRCDLVGSKSSSRQSYSYTRFGYNI